MADARQLILDWAEHGHIAAADVPRAMRQAGVLPSPAGWRTFVDYLLLGLGVALVAGGLIFFLAYNWADLDRFAKLGLAQAALVVALGFVLRLGLDRPAGQAALGASVLVVGALLALIGQTYQTGADTFELFAAWAALVLPWVAVARFSPLWLFWILLVNVATALYVPTMGGLFGGFFTDRFVLWALLAINTGALAVWEWTAARGVPWLQSRWEPRVLATASGVCVTVLASLHLLGDEIAAVALVAWLAWLGAAWAVYRRTVKDLFVLAGGVLSVIVVSVTAFMSTNLLQARTDRFLVLGLIVIALSAAGGWWLKQVGEEAR